MEERMGFGKTYMLRFAMKIYISKLYCGVAHQTIVALFGAMNSANLDFLYTGHLVALRFVFATKATDIPHYDVKCVRK